MAGYSDRQFKSTNTTLFNDGYSSLYDFPNIESRSSQNIQTTTGITGDFNNDGLKELIIPNGNYLNIYQNKTLDLVFSVDMQGPIIDIQAYKNGNASIIMVSRPFTNNWTWSVLQFKYNSTGGHNLIPQASHINEVLSLPDYTGAQDYTQFKFACMEIEQQCLAIATLYNSQENLYYFNYNTTPYINLTSVGHGAGFQHRGPVLGFISIGDIDGDTNREFVWSVATSSNKHVWLQAARIVNNGVKIVANTDIQTYTYEMKGIFTSPIVGDFTPQSSNSVVIGVMDSANTYKLHSYYFSSGSFRYFNSHPQIFSFSGNFLSNPFRAKAFEYQSSHDDYCILGYISGSNSTTLDCGTDFGVPWYAFDSRRWTTQNYTNYFQPDANGSQVMAHSVLANLNTKIYNGRSVVINDILLPFGIYKLGDVDIFGHGDLEQTFSVNLGRGIIRPINIENSIYDDIFFLTPSYAYYIDDKWLNKNAQVRSYTINPCKTNINYTSSVTISATLYDEEGDLIKARAYLYYGDDNEQVSDWTSYVPSGSVPTFNFIANKTIANGIIRFETIDNNAAHTAPNALTDFFTVTVDGFAYGECITQSGDILVTDEDIAIAEKYEQNITLDDNKIKEAIYDIANVSGIPVLLFFMLLMLGLNATIFIVSASHSVLSNHIIPIILFLLLLDFISIIIATLIGIISAAFLISMILVIILIGVVYIGYLWNKSSGG